LHRPQNHQKLNLATPTVDFCLALPQSTLPATTKNNLLSQFNSASTPAATNPPPVTTPIITLDNLEDLPATNIALLGVNDGTDTIADYDIACYAKFTPSQLANLIRRIPTATPATTRANDPVKALLSPRMAAVLASITGSALSGHSFYGSLDFLDAQTSFDTVFPHPSPILLSLTTAGTPTIDTTTISSTINTFANRCKFELFIPLFRTDYVGTAGHDDTASLYATVQAIKKLSMSYRHPQTGSWVNWTPDELFAAYGTLIPLLPSRVQLWGFNLVNQYHDSLSPDIQDLIVTNVAYTAPSIVSLTTRATQLAALRCLRVCAVHHHTNIGTQ
jgi:hypothetical protein